MAAVAGTPTGPKTYAANPNSVYYFSPSNALAATAASTITVAATTPDALVDTVPVSADASTSLVVCSADALHIYGASVTFTQP